LLVFCTWNLNISLLGLQSFVTESYLLQNSRSLLKNFKQVCENKELLRPRRAAATDFFGPAARRRRSKLTGAPPPPTTQ